MRILIINKYAHVTGGADTHCLALAAALTDRGHAVSFLSTRSPENVVEDGLFVEASVTRATKHTLSPRGQFRAVRTALWNGEAYDAMWRLIRSFRPDLVNAHKVYPQLSVSPLAAARRARIPVIQTVQDYEFVGASPYDHTGRAYDHDSAAVRDRLLNTALYAMRRGVHRSCVTAWLTVSEYVAATLARKGIRARVVPNIAPPVPAGVPALEQRDGVAFVGRLGSEKGVEHVIELAERLPRITVRVAGDGVARSRIEHAAASLPNLHYVGPLPVADVRGLFASSRVAIVPSLWQEPGALVTLEAMSVGTPLVVYDVGGIAEYVSGSDAGLVVEPDAALLAAGCERLLGDEQAWWACSQAGQEAAGGRFSARSHCQAFEAIATEMLTASGPG
jgi:glycosyltransferase involved in cell wall biosynthesis